MTGVQHIVTTPRGLSPSEVHQIKCLRSPVLEPLNQHCILYTHPIFQHISNIVNQVSLSYIDLWLSSQSGISLHRVHLCKKNWLPENKQYRGISRSRGLRTGRIRGRYEVTYTRVPISEQSLSQTRNHLWWRRGKQWPTANPGWEPFVKEAKT